MRGRSSMAYRLLQTQVKRDMEPFPTSLFLETEFPLLSGEAKCPPTSSRG